jgi:hypothetical protein
MREKPSSTTCENNSLFVFGGLPVCKPVMYTACRDKDIGKSGSAACGDHLGDVTEAQIVYPEDRRPEAMQSSGTLGNWSAVHYVGTDALSFIKGDYFQQDNIRDNVRAQMEMAHRPRPTHDSCAGGMENGAPRQKMAIDSSINIIISPRSRVNKAHR